MIILGSERINLKTSISTDGDSCAFPANSFGKLPKNTNSRDYLILNKGFLSYAKELVQNVAYEVKCRKALWSRAREAFWSNCKQTQPSESRFFLYTEYELLSRSLCSIKA